MKILIISWEYPPVLVGGLGKHVHSLATSLAAEQHEVVVLTRNQWHTDPLNYPTTDLVKNGVRVIFVPEAPFLFDFKHDLTSWTLAMQHSLLHEWLKNYAKNWQPDIIHAHDWLVAYTAKTLADYYQIPLITTVHATEAGRHHGWLTDPTKRQIHAIERWLTQNSSAVITCSKAMAIEVSKLFTIDLEKIITIPNTIDLENWKYASLPKKSKQLLFVGRLEYEKGIQDLLHVLPELKTNYPDLNLEIVGTGTYAAELKTLTETLNIKSVVNFSGSKTSSQVVKYMQQADILVLPSHYEPFGIVALEAAAAGTPIVASNTGGLAEVVIHKKTGITYNPGDRTALKQALLQTLADPIKAKERAQQARTHVEKNFTRGKNLKTLLQVYKNSKYQHGTALSKPKIEKLPLNYK